MGDKRKHKFGLEEEKEMKKIKIADSCDAKSLVQETCGSNTGTPSDADPVVLSQETGAHDSEDVCLKKENESENIENTDEINAREEDVQEKKDHKNDCSVDESEKSLIKQLECEGDSYEKEEGLRKAHSPVDNETFQETSDINKYFKRPRSAVSPSPLADSISEKASNSPDSEGTFRCGKKLKIYEAEEENIEPGCSSIDNEDSDSEQTKEDENVQCSGGQNNPINDPAISPDNSDIKELNVVEFCRLNSFDQASVLNGNDHTFEQSSVKESFCDDGVFGGPRESFTENNNSFPLERNVFPGVQQEVAHEFPPRRRRKKHIINALQKLLEFYLSRGNVSKDKFLQQKMHENGYVDLTVFLSFNKVKCLTDELKLLKYAARNSSILELSSDETKVKLKLGYPDKENEYDCTVYVDYLPRTATRDWVCHYFTQFGDVEFVSLPLFKDSKRSRGFAFVEFRVPASAQLAVDSHEGRHTVGNFGFSFSHLNSSTDAHVNSSKYESLHAVPDSSSQGDDENSNRVERDEVSTAEHVTAPTTGAVSAAAATTAGSEAESTNRTAENLFLKRNNDTRDNNATRNVESKNEYGTSGSNEDPAQNFELSASFEDDQQLPLPQRICKNSRLKRFMGKRKLVGPGLTDRFLVIPKRVWLERRKAYLAEQKKGLGLCKAIMAAERLQEEALKIEFDGPRPQKQMPVKVPGVVVKVTLDKPVVDKASLIAGVKSMGGTGVEFVDCSVGEKIVHVRFSSREGANTFRHATTWKSKSSIIEGQEEEEFWKKVHSCWTARITKRRVRKKIRGKDKIISRWRKRREALEGTCSDVIPDPNTDQE